MQIHHRSHRGSHSRSSAPSRSLDRLMWGIKLAELDRSLEWRDRSHRDRCKFIIDLTVAVISDRALARTPSRLLDRLMWGIKLPELDRSLEWRDRSHCD